VEPETDRPPSSGGRQTLPAYPSHAQMRNLFIYLSFVLPG